MLMGFLVRDNEDWCDLRQRLNNVSLSYAPLERS